MTSTALYPKSYGEAVEETKYNKGALSANKKAKRVHIPKAYSHSTWGAEVEKIIDYLSNNPEELYAYPAGDNKKLRYVAEKVRTISLFKGYYLRCRLDKEKNCVWVSLPKSLNQ